MGPTPTRIPTVQLAIDHDTNFLLHHAVDAVAIAETDVTGPGAAIGGVAMSAGMTALLTSQSAPTEQGKWTWTGAATAMTRAHDMNASEHFRLGTRVYCRAGDYANTTWLLSALSASPFVLDTDEPTFMQTALSEGVERRYNMTSAEATNGSRTDFTFGPEWSADVNNVVVYLNGVRQLEGETNDYTINGTPAVAFNSAPPGGSKVCADFDVTVS